MLIVSPRHTRRDLDRWAELEREDAVRARHPRLATLASMARVELARFRPDYVGVSWGKDSVVLAHLARQVDSAWPLVWVRAEGVENPDCVLVRDAFLAQWPGVYDEISVAPGPDGKTSAPGFAEAARRYGPRYASGVRADESGSRRLRARAHGCSTETTCAPLSWWTAAHVFAYLHLHGLPVHPAYACLGGHTWERHRLRVGAVGGERGRGHGRAEWERRYYSL